MTHSDRFVAVVLLHLGVAITALIPHGQVVSADARPAADQSEVQRVLNKYQSVRPREADLALYQLDWMPTLKAAEERAAREERPIFLVVVTNSFGDLFSGHC